ncbi:MAG: aminotransferase class I/II-fold pyridoxal phosphate-dependent enzyme [Cryomorphaceae bacterium]|nr:aminotransferase class I/II-fold pyridoxal phosphate-dependent enzyme [Cryomorphaceae bacterium]
MTKIVDLRSDTVTQPTDEMKKAMFDAPVGDDVIDIDPSVRKLEDYAAQLFGFERGLFCPSGTMTNQIALMLHTRPGDEIICDALSHIYWYEGGGPAANAGASLRLLPGDQGRISASQIEAAINPKNEHAARTALVSLENTCNKAGGSFYNLDAIKEIRRITSKHHLPLHLDGARIFNALVASRQSTLNYHGLFDSMSICLSKGLGCPVGSLLLLNEKDYFTARRIRKRLGGGMRQSGFLAAAGFYALHHHVDRLAEDHRRAKALAAVLEDCDWVDRVVEPSTNILVFYPKIKEETVISALERKGIRLLSMGGGALRLVTHLHITDEDIEYCRNSFFEEIK